MSETHEKSAVFDIVKREGGCICDICVVFKCQQVKKNISKYSLAVLNGQNLHFEPKKFNKHVEQNTRSTRFLFHFISYVGELWTSLHCYHKNGNNVNHGQMLL